MNLFDFVFKTIENLGQMDTTQVDNLRKDSNRWYDQIDLKKLGETDEQPQGWQEQFKQINEFWVVRLLLAILFVPFLKFVRDFDPTTLFNSGDDYDEGEEIPEQEDDDITFDEYMQAYNSFKAAKKMKNGLFK